MVAALIGALAFATVASQAADPLPSWNDGPAKQSIINFVEKVTKPGAPDFVPLGERIATFDNDGTLWCEQPVPVQLYFALDRAKALAPQHPDWSTTEPFASLLKGDLQTTLAGGDHALIEVVMATHPGMTTAEFEQIVKDWIATAKHPKTGQLFTDMVYQPMLEVLSYFRANGFKNFIVSGGGIEFMRPWTERVYGIPPEQVRSHAGTVSLTYCGAGYAQSAESRLDCTESSEPFGLPLIAPSCAMLMAARGGSMIS
ncbi:HAD family hydrolase [Bradyrhizobium sp. LA7.1]|uniref:HAD family hydrolase n=1 Tax=Bradyrhizobium sp. LA7.1 TaxID=3156324 RepID=UPI00339541C6